MDYGVAVIGIKTKKGKVIRFGYGLDNEIIPILHIDKDWKKLFSDKEKREDFLSKSFDCDGYSLKDIIEEFDSDELGDNYTKEFNKFINKVKNINNDELDLIVLGVCFAHGICEFEFNVLNYEYGTNTSKEWKERLGRFEFPDESCIDKVLNNY